MIEIKEKVIQYIKSNSYIGIVLKKEIQSFGWAGCRDIIQGEFIKNIEDMKKIQGKNFSYEVKDIEGVKVFIPEYLKSVKDIRIGFLFSVFSKLMILDIEVNNL